MSRFEFVAATAVAVMVFALAGCASVMPSMPGWMTPNWMSSKPSGPAMQSLRFESDPPGAEVRTAQGQTCNTPCELTVPSESQSVSFAKKGFVLQTTQVGVGDPPKHSFWESPPPSLVPNPVQVVLKPLRHPASHS
jgi:PEGA domain